LQEEALKTRALGPARKIGAFLLLAASGFFCAIARTSVTICFKPMRLKDVGKGRSALWE